MPSISSNTVAAKTEKVIPVLDLPEAFKAAASVVEKKCRNLEKRKGKLDGYREEQSKGKKLSAEILQAVSHFDEVVATLELARSLIQEFEKIAIDSSKDEKKKKAQEHADRKQSELTRLKDVLSIQEVFSCLCSSTNREDLLNGCRGAPEFSETDLQKLDAFFSHIAVDRNNLTTTFDDQVTSTALHYQNLLDNRNKEVAGSSYREIKGMIQRIITAGYFDWKPQPEIVEPEPPKEPQVEAVPEIHHQELYHSVPDERTFINSGFEYNEPSAPLPTMPQVPQTTGYFPVDIDTDFNFIQESLIDSHPVLPLAPQTSVPVSLASMDSAVMMVHSQVPHSHLAAYSLMSGNPAAATAGVASTNSMYTGSSLIPGSAPPSTLPTAELIAEAARTASPIPLASTEAAHSVNPSAAHPTTTTSSTWAEEPQDDMPPFQQENNRKESNTWTNSNYRPNEQGQDGGRRGAGFRGRGNNGPRGGQRGGGGGGNGSGSGSSSGFYNNSRSGGERNYGGDRDGNAGGGDRSDRRYGGDRDRFQGNGGGERNGMDRSSYQRDGDRSYQSNNGGGRYQNSNGGGGGDRSYQSNNNQGGGSYRSDRGGERSSYAPRGNFRGGPPRGGPRGGGGPTTRGTGGNFDRGTSFAAKE